MHTYIHTYNIYIYIYYTHIRTRVKAAGAFRVSGILRLADLGGLEALGLYHLPGPGVLGGGTVLGFKV